MRGLHLVQVNFLNYWSPGSPSSPSSCWSSPYSFVWHSPTSAASRSWHIFVLRLVSPDFKYLPWIYLFAMEWSRPWTLFPKRAPSLARCAELCLAGFAGGTALSVRGQSQLRKGLTAKGWPTKLGFPKEDAFRLPPDCLFGCRKKTLLIFQNFSGTF